MIRVFLLFIYGLLLAQQALSQRHVKDSLLNVLEKSARSSNKVDLLNALSYEYYNINDSIALAYATQALQEAVKLKYLKGVKQAYTLVGLGYVSNGDYQQAFANFYRSLQIVVKDGEAIATYTYNLLGNVHRDLSNYDSAIFYYNLSSKTNEKIGDKNAEATTLKNLGYTKILTSKNDEAINDLLKAENILRQQSKHDNYLMAEIWGHLGKAYEANLNFTKAQDYYTRMCSMAGKAEDNFLLIKCELNKAKLAFRLGDFSKSLEYCFEAVRISEVYAYPPQVAEIYIKIGDAYIELAQHDLATEYFFRALKITEKLKLQRLTAEIYSALSWINKEESSFTMALEYINRSQDIRENIHDQYGISNCHRIRGLIYHQLKQYSSAITELEKSRRIRESIGNLEGVAATVLNLSLVYEDQKKFSLALSLQQEAIAIQERIGNKQSLSGAYNNISRSFIRLGRLGDAENYLKKARSLIDQTKSRLDLRNNYGFYALLYEAHKNFAKAYEYQKLYQQLNDSIYTRSSAVKMAEMQTLYQLEKKDQEIQLLNNEKVIHKSQLEIQKSSLRFQLLIIVSVAGGLFLISAVALSIYRNSRRVRKLNMAISEQNEEIQAQAEELSESNRALTKLNAEIIEKNEEIQAQSEELIEASQSIAQINRSLEDKVEERTTELKQAYKELDTFFYRASHDFRRPLTTFMGLAEVAKITIKDPNALELFSKVNDTAHYLDKMLMKLQSISDVGGQELVYKEAFLKDIFDNVRDTFREDLKRKNIKTYCEIGLKESFYSYPALLRIIIENLVENSIFFSGVSDPIIRFKAYSSGGVVVMEIQDNGEGIPDEYQDRIFEMYFRANERSKGNGLGLYIVKKAAEKLNGIITVKSTLHVGTTFTVSFSGK